MWMLARGTILASAASVDASCCHSSRRSRVSPGRRRPTKRRARSSPPTLLEEVLPLCAKNPPNQVQSSDGRAPAYDAALTRRDEVHAVAAVRRQRVEVDGA